MIQNSFCWKKQGWRFRWEVSALLVIKNYFLQRIYLSGMYCTNASMASFIFMVCKFNTFFRGNWELRSKNVICLLIFVDWYINEVHFLLILHFIHLSFFTNHTRWTDLLDNLYSGVNLPPWLRLLFLAMAELKQVWNYLL